MAIIGLVGFKQVGKSTAAKYLEEKYGFTRHNFKDALVQELKDNFPDLLEKICVNESRTRITRDVVTVDKLFQEKPPLMRALMQNYGTDVRRKDSPNYWTQQWVKNLDIGKTVVDDVRFLNEAEAVKLGGGIIIRLTRSDIETGGTHLSETEQLEIVADHTIECDPGDHEALYRALDDIIK